MVWPRQEAGWGSAYATVTADYLALLEAILRFEPVILVLPERPPRLPRLEALRSQGLHTLTTVAVPTNDTWVRDFGPVTLRNGRNATLLDFRFNGWGGKFRADLDNQLTRRLIAAQTLPDQFRQVDMVLEGGNIDCDGKGALMTTSRCLLHPGRNPGLDKSATEQRLRETLGIERILWLDHGWLAGDDTDGHIDMLARFCPADVIAFTHCDDPRDPHFEPLNAMREALAAFRQPGGQRYELVSLLLPSPCLDTDGHRLPASYANFLVINGAVIAPVYQVPEDAIALRRLESLFPGREIVPVHARSFIPQSGSVHCLTMQLPAGTLICPRSRRR